MTPPIATKRCARCKEDKPLTEFSPNKRYTLDVSSYCKPCNSKSSVEYAKRNREKVTAYQRAWTLANRDRLTARNRERTQAIKQAAINAYGGMCACCDATELVWLTIDHVADDGAAKRRSGEHTHGHKFYVWLRDQGYPDGFQVLCFNCNWAKSHGGCPHQGGAINEKVAGLLEPC
jgi:hypothetical protein